MDPHGGSQVLINDVLPDHPILITNEKNIDIQKDSEHKTRASSEKLVKKD